MNWIDKAAMALSLGGKGKDYELAVIREIIKAYTEEVNVRAEKLTEQEGAHNIGAHSVAMKAINKELGI